MNVNNGKYSRKETSRKLLKEMTYLFVALYLFAMITYTGQGFGFPRLIMPRDQLRGNIFIWLFSFLRLIREKTECGN